MMCCNLFNALVVFEFQPQVLAFDQFESDACYMWIKHYKKWKICVSHPTREGGKWGADLVARSLTIGVHYIWFIINKNRYQDVIGVAIPCLICL
jgi:hypothetical protein